MFAGQQTIIRALLLVILVGAVVSRKRDVSWFGSTKAAKIQSPNLEQVNLQQPIHQDTHDQSLQDSSKKLKTITDVIDETLTTKMHDTIMEEAEATKLKKYSPLGCFKDDASNRSLPVLLADLQRSIDWTDLTKIVRVCAVEAQKAGYQVFGIQKFGICYSGKEGWHTFDIHGKSKDCVKGVGRYGSNMVYTFKPPVIPMKRPTVYCFPKLSQVETFKKHRVPMSNVRIGDRLKTLDRQGKPVYSEVIAFLHRQEKSTADYLSIQTSNGRTLRVSDKHLVFRVDNTTNRVAAVFASALKVGDRLQTVGRRTVESSRVVKITMATEVGVFAPLTRHGTMIVDGVLVSCYAHWDSHTVAHITMAPLRLWTDLTSFMTSLSRLFGISGHQTTRVPQGINWYALSLMNIVETFVSLQ